VIRQRGILPTGNFKFRYGEIERLSGRYPVEPEQFSKPYGARLCALNGVEGIAGSRHINA
jgi:hypothetical protein